MSDNLTIDNFKTESKSKRSFGFWLVFSLVIIALTQFARWLVLENDFSIFKNDKFAFSLDIPVLISYLLYLGVFFFIMKFLYQNWFNSPVLTKLGFSFILCGGISNLFERLKYGYVVDYFYIGSGVLNIADSYIIFGAVLVFISYKSRHK